MHNANIILKTNQMDMNKKDSSSCEFYLNAVGIFKVTQTKQKHSTPHII